MKDLLFDKQRDDSLRFECEYCDAAIGERCVNPKTRAPIERQTAHHARLVAAGVVPSASAEQRCECCDLPAYSCGKPKETAELLAQAAERCKLISEGWTPAHYRGVCAQCGQRFGINALIRYAGDGGWRAECCS